MRRTFQSIAVVLGFLLLTPLAANAHDNDGENQGFGLHGKIRWNWNFSRHQSGTVTAVGSASFELKNQAGEIFTVNTDNAKITEAFSGKITLSDMQVNDMATVIGKINNNQIEAKTVIVTPPNTHKAAAVGKVTAVSGNTVTLETNNWGVPGTVTVKTNASTTYSQNSSSTTFSSLQVGAKIFVKGLWDEIQNVLNAFRIKIR